MFRGNHPARIEESGRLKLPVPFKQLLDADNVTDLYVTSEDGQRAKIWTLKAWEQIEANLAPHTTMNEAVEKYLDMTSYYGQQVKIDAQGRIVLPQILREAAKLEGELVVMGKITYLQVVNKSQFAQDLAARAISPDERKSVGAILAQVTKN
ncbi:MAG: division/cell wall cluster transcriptional repressor MraZ [Terracidiphilus sp.]|jgi:MraZ protein